MTNVLTQLQAPLIAAVATTAVAGLFAMASRVTGPLLLLPVSLTTVVVPELARRWKTGEAWPLYRTFSRICLAYALIAVLCAWPIGIVVTRIAGPQYSAAVPIVAGLVAAAGLSAYTQAFASMLIAAGHPQRATVCVAAGGVVALALLAVLGVWGPVASLGAAQIVAEVVVLAAVMVAVHRLKGSEAESR